MGVDGRCSARERTRGVHIASQARRHSTPWGDWARGRGGPGSSGRGRLPARRGGGELTWRAFDRTSWPPPRKSRRQGDLRPNDGSREGQESSARGRLAHHPHPGLGGEARWRVAPTRFERVFEDSWEKSQRRLHAMVDRWRVDVTPRCHPSSRTASDRACPTQGGRGTTPSGCGPLKTTAVGKSWIRVRAYT